MKSWKLKLCLEQPTAAEMWDLVGGVLALEFAQFFRQGDVLSGLAVL
jgi:hypothetical protein